MTVVRVEVNGIKPNSNTRIRADKYGLHPDPDYVRFKNHLKNVIPHQWGDNPKLFESQFIIVTFTVDQNRHDCDNLVKAVLDAMVQGKKNVGLNVLANDSTKYVPNLLIFTRKKKKDEVHQIKVIVIFDESHPVLSLIGEIIRHFSIPVTSIFDYFRSAA